MFDENTFDLGWPLRFVSFKPEKICNTTAIVFGKSIHAVYKQTIQIYDEIKDQIVL